MLTELREYGITGLQACGNTGLALGTSGIRHEIGGLDRQSIALQGQHDEMADGDALVERCPIHGVHQVARQLDGQLLLWAQTE